jgi:hypothetical protein
LWQLLLVLMVGGFSWHPDFTRLVLAHVIRFLSFREWVWHVIPFSVFFGQLPFLYALVKSFVGEV